MNPLKNKQLKSGRPQDLREWDEDLAVRARGMKDKILAPPELWRRIEELLEEERQNPVKRSSFRAPVFRPTVLVPSFAFLLIVLIGFFLAGEGFDRTTGLLPDRMVRRIEKREAAYIEAISRLEEKALSRMGDLNLEVMLLYRERLNAINEQIQNCREMLESNPANAHIRRYMAAALQDKKETLGELLKWKNPANG